MSAGQGEAAPILIVEDDPLIAELVMLGLGKGGYEATWARSGAEALERIGEVDPALILLDLGLPKIDGFGVLSEIRRRRATGKAASRRLPIIIMTGRDSTDDLRKAASLGATGHLAKPFGIPQLLSRIAEQLLGPG